MMKPIAEQRIQVYNSLSGSKEEFIPLHGNMVGMYVCGPTVYNNVHLGNCRTFISFDIIFRYLKHLGYKVRYVRNITDAGHLENDADEGEDRIAKKARIEEIEPMEVVQKYTVDFHRTLAKFNTLPRALSQRPLDTLLNRSSWSNRFWTLVLPMKLMVLFILMC